MSDTVVFTDHTFDDLDIEREILDEADAELIDGEAAEAPLETVLEDADPDAVIVMYEDVDGDLLDLIPDCRVVSRTGIGFDNVDLDAATDRGVYARTSPTTASRRCRTTPSRCCSRWRAGSSTTTTA
jgi:D-3-phosphoglycerate dehydrogenase